MQKLLKEAKLKLVITDSGLVTMHTTLDTKENLLIILHSIWEPTTTNVIGNNVWLVIVSRLEQPESLTITY